MQKYETNFSRPHFLFFLLFFLSFFLLFSFSPTGLLFFLLLYYDSHLSPILLPIASVPLSSHATPFSPPLVYLDTNYPLRLTTTRLLFLIKPSHNQASHSTCTVAPPFQAILTCYECFHFNRNHLG